MTPPASNDNDAAPEASSASADELLAGAHLDDIEVDGDPAGDTAGAGADTPPAPAVLTREQFAETWCAMFNIGSAMSGLKSLSVESAEVKPRAIAAAHVVYEIAEETPAMRWLIEPGNVWVQRAFILGAFAVPMGQGVREELRARRAKPVNPSPSRERDQTRAAANDNQPEASAAAPDPFAWAPAES